MIVPGSDSPLLLTKAGYFIQRSLRFRSSASAYLNRTPSVAGNRQTWTWSGWVKRGLLSGSATYGIIEGNAGATDLTALRFANDTLNVQDYSNGGGYNLTWATSAVFRDPSAWYHIVLAYDTTQASSANAIKIYVNGVQQSVTFTAVSGSYVQNRNSYINSTSPQRIGVYNGLANYFDGYLTEVNFIDGQALTPSSFGQTDPVTGVWQPKKYTGTYGTNGFYLPFSDNTSATTLAYDKSGNSNNWTPNNISTTAGATYDSMTDVPTLTSDTVANYAVLNPLAANPAVTAAQGNLSYTSSNDRIIKSTISVTSGKWYWEFAPGGGGSTSGCGAINPSVNIYAVVNLNIATAGVSYLGNGNKSVNGTATSYGATYTSGDVIGVALDLDANTITFYKNNASQGSISITSGLEWCPAFDQNTGTNYVNFGQRPFSYTPSSGFKALNTFNLPDSTIKAGNKYMDATLYTGTGSALSVTNSGSMQPDFVWIKGRSAAYEHALFDSVRGARNLLRSNATAAEVLETAGTSMTSFDSGGFSLGTNGATASTNVNGSTFVGWQWQAGKGTTSSNTSGSITSTVSVNPTAGFSIVTYTGNGSNPATVGHGLGVAPKMIILKRRNSAVNWFVYANAAGNGAFEGLNTTAAYNNALAIFNNTAPTSAVFSLGSTDGNTNSGTYVAYCFAEIAGFSKFGSYTGNGSSDGTFVYCGFRPRWLMIKRTDAAGYSWVMLDSSRDTYNPDTTALFANTSDADSTGYLTDFLSNGFKLRSTVNSQNASGGTYIFAAFAENPFKNSLAR